MKMLALTTMTAATIKLICEGWLFLAYYGRSSDRLFAVFSDITMSLAILSTGAILWTVASYDQSGDARPRMTLTDWEVKEIGNAPDTDVADP